MKLVLFDCDGTLVDSQHMIVAAMECAFRKHDLVPPPRLQILSVVGLSLTIAVARLLPPPHDGALIHNLAEDYKGAFSDLRRDPSNNEPMYPGMRDLVLDIAQRDETLLGIATGKSRRGVATILAREHIGDAFQTIQTADTNPSKPDPAMVFEAMTEAGASAEETVIIGDTTFDIEMGLAAGASVIGVAWGYHPVAELKAAGATQLVATATELRHAVEEFLKTGSPVA